MIPQLKLSAGAKQDAALCIRLPLSKSISSRLLILRFLSGDILNTDYLAATDTLELAVSLEMVRKHYGKGAMINGGSGGTGIRFLLALLSVSPGEWFLDCSPAFSGRPIMPLIDALRVAGAHIEHKDSRIFPLKIIGKPLNPGVVTIDNSLSSQFLSALLMIAPCFESDTLIKPLAKLSSQPYVEMTLQMMKKAGIVVAETPEGYYVKMGGYVCEPDQTFERDWSAASFWYAFVVLQPWRSIYLPELKIRSLQGDRWCMELFGMLGVETQQTPDGIIIRSGGRSVKKTEADFFHHPDLAMPFIMTCAGLGLQSVFTGLDSLNVKESKRLNVIIEGLAKLGVKTENPSPSVLRIFPSSIPPKVVFNTHKDHRMVMSFALMSSVCQSIILDYPESVSKSYPAFWDDMRKAGFKAEELS